MPDAIRNRILAKHPGTGFGPDRCRLRPNRVPLLASYKGRPPGFAGEAVEV